MRRAAWAVLAAGSSLAAAQSNGNCVSLSGSKACPAFASASVSKNAALIKTYPFLQFVSDSASFDYQLTTYVKTSYVKDKYQNVLGCSGINFTDTSGMYARYTTTVLCNTLVQQSSGECGLSKDASRPVCADTCADFAQSEAFITADKDLCSTPGADLTKLIRADFTVCSLPEGSLQGKCISGFENEPENCGFGNSTVGLCSYCKAGGINSTDTCCYNADAEKRCEGVKLPTITATMTFSTPTTTSTPTSTTSPAGDGGSSHDKSSGLSGGAIAGIVVGSLAGVALIAVLLLFCIRRLRRRDGSQSGSIFNQPSPARKGPSMSQMRQSPPEGYEVLPGGRVARMSALEGHSSGSPTHHSRNGTSTAAAAAGFMAGRGKGGDTQSSSDEYGESPESEPRGVLRPPPASRRQGSLSSGSLLASDPQSPGSGGDYSSPLGVASQNSEQLPFFKDYYSQDDIHPADKVSVLWAYQPRAPDEFALERGDMLKVVGIWDDGWATGVMLDERADEWEVRRQTQRDSGVSNTSEPRDSSPAATHGEMKAFPLVCVCLPEHWRKTIEGDGSTDTNGSGIANAPPNV
ncbi:SH3 domain-containing protein [Purpureocillium lilacinum]|nr:SH3 domain-containing protein [Purpureocillium lilacinum]OAQ86809.1 SH3 domain-containing protein [Purpureocillium lilacinum]OAQ94776.1 SH3 domain-containing protein [Purpureocillium lilacinum]PWI70397.1 uncharacterized protein PCL_12796 [Purpureocillium lilacinum]GJN66946.1 hypothetical protein PLICBS_000968 [Purpureocillium lilacinum]GJN80886.1 hypothetical protein PLIIFM63780_004416 [Purpureocillium lilacinum]